MTDESSRPTIESAQVVMACPELGVALAFFTERLGFRVAAIHPADSPRVAVLSGHGIALRLEEGGRGDPGTLRLLCRDLASGGPTELVAPNGTRIELVEADPPLVVPDGHQCLVISRLHDAAAWGVGRAGMQYRDLLPGRQGGRFIASHIRIPDGGPVPDYVHYHRIRFQLIYCYRGWVRVVYEDQGPPFVLHAGDCVLQPPGIRHQVLESSPGLEVVEIGCPADHDTFGDLELSLPTAAHRPERDFGGQRFVRHVAAAAEWRPWRVDGFECRDSGIAVATGGLAGVQVARVRRPVAPEWWTHGGELLFLFVLDGSVVLQLDGIGAEPLTAGDAVAVPADQRHALDRCSTDLELLEVVLPEEAPWAQRAEHRLER